jgi:hypothetical protein
MLLIISKRPDACGAPKLAEPANLTQPLDRLNAGLRLESGPD